MLNEYPEFKKLKGIDGTNKGQIELIYQKLPNNKKSELEDYLTYRKAREHIELDTIKNLRRRTIEMYYICPEGISSLKKLREFLSLVNSTKIISEATRNNIKADLKRFLKWKYEDWSKRFSELEDISYSRVGVNEQKINSKTMLNKQDIEKIMQHETKMFWKAFFITQYEAGLRTKETRFLKWDDIKFNIEGELSEINIYATKTSKARTIFVKEATHYLKLLKEEQENTETKGTYVFHSKRDLNKPIDKGSISIWARGLAKKGGKYFWNYLLRHSRGTELYTLAYDNKIAESTATKFMGHSKSMIDTYLHLDKDKLKKMLRNQVYKLEQTPEQEKDIMQKVNEMFNEKMKDIEERLTLKMKAEILKNKK